MITVIINTLFLFVFIAYSIFFFQRLRFQVIPIFYLYVIQFWMVLSVYTLDFGGFYIYELKITSSRTLATSFLIVGNIVFFESIRRVLEKRGYIKNILPSRQVKKVNYRKIQVMNLVISAVIIAYYSAFLVSGVPLLIGMDRASFSEILSSIPIVGFLWRNYLLVCFFIGYSYSFQKIRNSGHLLPLVQITLIVLFLIMGGNRFSAIFSALTAFLISPVLFGLFKVKSFDLKKTIRWGAMVVIFFLGTTILQSSTYSYSANIFGDGKLLAYLFERIFILQGEIWWKTYHSIVTEGGYLASHLWTEVKNLFGLPVEGYTGLKYLMVEAANGSFIYEILEGNYMYTGAFPAIILATFNWSFFFFVMIGLGKIFGHILVKFKNYLFSDNLLKIYLIYILYSTYNSMILGGAFDNFIMSSNVLRVLMLIGIALLIFHEEYKNKKDG